METEKKSNGALIGLIIIIIILIIGGIYMLKMNKNNTQILPNENEATTEELDLNNLEQDLENADIDLGADVIQSLE